VSDKDPEKKDLDKRVRSLTTLTAQMEIPAFTAALFDSKHPLPEVCITQNVDFCCFVFLHYAFVIDIVFSNALCRTTSFWFLALIYPRKDRSKLILLLLVLKPPRLANTRTEMKPKDLWRRAVLLRRLPLPSLKIEVWRKRGSA
jgi:hypothetical protein